MDLGKGASFGKNANQAVGDWASRVDDQTGAVGQRVAGMIVVAARLLRIPSAVVLVVPIPFILGLGVVAASSDGVGRTVCAVLTVLMAAVTIAFGVRRSKILAAVEEPDRLATELGIMISLSDKVTETRGALTQLAGGGGWRLFSRLQGAWKGAGMTGRWIDQVGDLPRARYFAPPKIGTTVTLTVAALWLIPISMVALLFGLIAAVAGTL